MIVLLSVMVRSALTSLILAKKYAAYEEPVTKFSTPSNWKTEVYEARYQGLMYAGMSEFNWLLDIRMEDRDSEAWSVGNLITYYHVLTTCRGVTTLERYITGSDRYVFQPVAPRLIRVNFCATYLWYDLPDAYFFNPRGLRLVRSVTIHTWCDPYFLTSDFALLTLTTGIHPLIPLTTYMPIPGKFNKKPNWGPIKHSATVCYIASFGKDHVNLKPSSLVGLGNLLKDHKIKYKVYFVEWDECSKYFDKICPYRDLPCSTTKINDQTFQEEVMCFRPRKKVGAICDHDRGAPLVCNGLVYGMVIRGVPKEFCHNLVQYPVLVGDIHNYVSQQTFLIKAQIQSYGPRNFVNSILEIAILGVYFLTYF